jgi:hypothetical protein
MFEMFETLLRVARAGLPSVRSAGPSVSALLSSDAKYLYEAGEVEWSCRAMLQAGNIWSDSGCLEEATGAFEWVKAIAGTPEPAAWRKEMVGLALGNLGIVANRAGQWDLAISRLCESLPELPQKYDRASTNAELALAYHRVGRSNQARVHIRDAKRLVNDLGVTKSVMESYLHLFRCPTLLLYQRNGS